MKYLLHRLLQRVRSLLIDWAAGMMNWASDEIHYCIVTWGDDHSSPIEARALVVDRFANWLFNLAHPGSDEEIDIALDGGMPAQYLNERQRAACMEAFANPCYECLHCQWVGFLHEAHSVDAFEKEEGLFCPSCEDDSLYLRDRSQVWVPYRDHRALAVVPSCALVKGGAS